MGLAGSNSTALGCQPGPTRNSLTEPVPPPGTPFQCDSTAGRLTAMARPGPQERMPATKQAKVDSPMELIDAFGTSRLNGECRQLIHAAVCALTRNSADASLTW